MLRDKMTYGTRMALFMVPVILLWIVMLCVAAHFIIKFW